MKDYVDASGAYRMFGEDFIDCRGNWCRTERKWKWAWGKHQWSRGAERQNLCRWGEGFYDYEGNYIRWGNTYKDSSGAYRRWGEDFVDGAGNWVRV